MSESKIDRKDKREQGGGDQRGGRRGEVGRLTTLHNRSVHWNLVHRTALALSLPEEACDQVGKFLLLHRMHHGAHVHTHIDEGTACENLLVSSSFDS